MADDLSSLLHELKIDRGPAPPARPPAGRRLALGVVAAAALVGAGVAAQRSLGSDPAPQGLEVLQTSIRQEAAPPEGAGLVAAGYVRADAVARVGAKAPGRVSKVLVRQGDAVAAGQRLFEIDAVEQQAAVDTGSAQVVSARTRVQVARAQLAEARRQSERAQVLARGSAMAPAEAEDLALRVATLEEQLKEAEAGAAVAESQLRALRVGLEERVVTAPSAGTILNRPPAVGDLVGVLPIGVALPGGMVEIADFARLMIEADVPEAQLEQLQPGQGCQVTIDAFPSRRYRGTVKEILPQADRARGTVTVRVELGDGPRDGIRPEMGARVTLLARAQAGASPPRTLVPTAAVAESRGERFVYVVSGGRARRQPVTVGARVGDDYELLQGPAPGTRIVNRPPPDLAEGQAVRERTAP